MTQYPVLLQAHRGLAAPGDVGSVGSSSSAEQGFALAVCIPDDRAGPGQPCLQVTPGLQCPLVQL